MNESPEINRPLITPDANSERSPQSEFAAFGRVKDRPLSRIQKLVASAMQKNWSSIPHVTHHDEADISSLELLRRKRSEELGVKLTLLPFIMKAAVAALRRFPDLNSSLDATRNILILKDYYHIGFAVDGPSGLLVPVVRDADTKSVAEIGREIAEVVDLARTKGYLPLTRMSGGSFTISSLGAVGGLGFTPIINAPEVAVMGISKTNRRPFEADGRIDWRTMLPLSLSYDHRVINGSMAGAFCVAFAEALRQPESL